METSEKGYIPIDPYPENMSDEMKEKIKRHANMMENFSTSPIFVVLDNDTERERKIKLFAPADNDLENENVSTPYSTISYPFIQKTLLAKEFNIGLIRLMSKNDWFRKKLEENPEQKNFFYEIKPLIVTHKAIFGYEAQMPIILSDYIDDEAEQKEMIEIEQNIKLDSGTSIEFSVPAKTRINAMFFVYKENSDKPIIKKL